MTPILSCPTEILIQVFSNESITSADIAKCAQTCKLFHEISSQVKIHYTFKVEYPSHKPWQLIRTLLKNPRVGDRFQSITVEWYRRNPDRPRTWAREWRWTEEETDMIKTICKEWDMMERLSGQYSTLCDAILAGWDSESLIPLLLTFTPNLKSLDYGRTSTMLEMVYSKHNIQGCADMYRYCVGKENEPRSHSGQLQDIGELWNTHGHNILWLSTVLDPDKPLPGLANLRNFSHGGGRFEDQFWSDSSFVSIILLPHIESLKLRDCPYLRDIGGWYEHKKDYGYKERGTGGKKSSIKRLELIDCGFGLDNYRTIAKCTNSLQSFKSTGCQHGEQVAESFLECNKETLLRDRISISESRTFVPNSTDRGDHSDHGLGSDDEAS